MLVTKLFCNQHFCKRSNNQLSYITFKTCFEISAVTPFGNYPGQLTLLFLRKNHFFGHTALTCTPLVAVAELMVTASQRHVIPLQGRPYEEDQVRGHHTSMIAEY